MVCCLMIIKRCRRVEGYVQWRIRREGRTSLWSMTSDSIISICGIENNIGTEGDYNIANKISNADKLEYERWTTRENVTTKIDTLHIIWRLKTYFNFPLESIMSIYSGKKIKIKNQFFRYTNGKSLKNCGAHELLLVVQFRVYKVKSGWDWRRYTHIISLKDLGVCVERGPVRRCSEGMVLCACLTFPTTIPNGVRNACCHFLYCMKETYLVSFFLSSF